MSGARAQQLLRSAHRWLGLIAGVQLLLWTASGLYFTIFPIEQIRSEGLRLEAPSALLRHTAMLQPSGLASMHPAALREARVQDVEIVERLGAPVYLVRNEAGEHVAFDAATGTRLEQLTREQALQVVAERTTILSHSSAPLPGPGAAATTALVTSAPPGTEYRGGELPAWRVVSADADTAVYVGSASGQLRAVRTNEWRLFDLMWSLHIIDYDEHENFRH